MTNTRFEEIIGNPKIFEIILDEFFHDWEGSYDVMTPEDPQKRFFEHHDHFSDFCQKVRSKPDGFRRCIDCDIRFAAEAMRQGKPIYYMCHAGLMDIAVPIVVGGELIATIFCGQSRAWDTNTEQAAQQQTEKTEIDLGFKKNELLELRSRTPIIPPQQIEDLKNRLWEVATYVSRLGSSKLEAEKAKKALAYRLDETEAIQRILVELSGSLDNVEAFWRTLDGTLSSICEIIGASHGVFVTCEVSIWDSENAACIRSSSNLPSSVLENRNLKCDLSIYQSIHSMQPIVIDLREEDAFADFLTRIRQIAPEEPLDKIAVIPVRLDPYRLGAMVFLISESQDVNKSLELQDELALLTQAATHIATAYGNCALYERQRELAEVQTEWLENVSHQILAPINAIVGHSENLSRHFRAWQKSSPLKIDNTLVTMLELGAWAHRLARNFAWVADKANRSRQLNLRLEQDVPGKLIGYARNVQGFARTRGIAVHVESESVKQLNDRIAIDNKLFKQAVTNVLDNAVKYADDHTEVSIDASISPPWAYINVSDTGIRLQLTEVHRIFDRYYRTEAAKHKSAAGSGIGLGIAREIMTLHGGNLIAMTSILTESGWKTTFQISLPLR